MNERTYFEQFVGDRVGVNLIEDKMRQAGFAVCSIEEWTENEFGTWKVNVKSLNIDMRGKPQEDLTNRLSHVELELVWWSDLGNFVVVSEFDD